MTKDELSSKLKPMAEGLQNCLTSRQFAFNYSRGIVDECKENGIRNKHIVEAINSHLPAGEQINLNYFKNMLARSKRKENKPSEEAMNEVLPKGNRPDPSKDSLSPQEHSNEEFNAYLCVCFNNERIARRAIENKIPIETIRSWQCPNVVRLSNVLGNHITYSGK